MGDHAASSAGAVLSGDVGSDEWNYQVKDLAEAVAEALPGTRLSINPEAPPDERSYRVDFSLFRQLAPAHQPHVRLEAVSLGSNRARAWGLTTPIFATRR